MLRLKHLSHLMLCAAFTLPAMVVEGREVLYDFSATDLGDWRIIGSGAWSIGAGRLGQTHGPYVEGAAVAPFVFDEGIITFDAVVPAAATARPHDAGIGLARYIDDANYWWVRFGDYGGTALKGRLKGAAIHYQLGRFTIQKGRRYRIGFALRGGDVLVALDGSPMYVLRDPLGPGAGRAGVYCLAEAEFDNLCIRDGAIDAAALAGLVDHETQAPDPAAAVATHPTPAFVTELPGPGTFRQDFASPDDIRMWHVGATGRGGGRQYVHVRDGALWVGRDRPDDVLAMCVARMGVGTITTRATLQADGDADVRWFAIQTPAGRVCFGRRDRCVLYEGRRPKGPDFGRFRPEVGRPCDIAVRVDAGRLTVSVDGQVVGEAVDADAGRVGQVGLLANVLTRFDHFSVSPWVPYESAPAPRVTGTPRPTLLQALYRPDDALGIEAFPIHGTLSLFFRNDGDGPARLATLRLDGAPLHAGSAPRHVVWSRQQPWAVEAGAVGEIQVRLRSMPTPRVLAMFAGDASRARATVSFSHVNGAPIDTEIACTPSLPPVQINFVAFDEDLTTLYVYVQNNARLYDDVPGAPTYRIRSVHVNGRDVTGRSRIPDAVVADDVVPLIVGLEQPLPERHEVMVSVATAEGAVAPICVRAFPSRLILQMTQNGGPARADMMQDIWHHGFNAVHFSTRRPEWAAQARALGLWHGIYGGHCVDDVLTLDRPEYGTTVGLWLDEVDKATPDYNFMALDWMAAYLRVQGRRPPLHYNGLVQSRTAGAFDYSVLTDAICRAQQATDLKEPETGRANVLRYMEHRQTRRPSLPYYRDAEIPVPFCPLTRRVFDPAPSRRRCLAPREARFLQYANFLQGAKGAYHWAYTDHPRDGFYEVHTPVLRLGNGGGVTPNVMDYAIPEHVRAMLGRAWDEIGRINIEMASVGHLVATGDVCYRARVVQATPPTGRGGAASVEVAATLAGDHSLVVFVLNHNFTYRPKSDARPSTFEPVDVTVGVRVPAWMDVQRVLRVTHASVTPLEARRDGPQWQFRFPALDVSELVVLTADPDVATAVRRVHAERAQRFAGVRRRGFPQVPWPDYHHRAVTYIWHAGDPFASLSDLTPRRVEPDASALSRNTMPDGSPLVALRPHPEGERLPADQRRVSFQKGLTLAADAAVTWDVRAAYSRFDCILAIDPDSTGSVVVTISCDGRPAAVHTLSATGPAARLALKLADVQALSIQTRSRPGAAVPVIVGHPRLLPVGETDVAVDLGIY